MSGLLTALEDLKINADDAGPGMRAATPNPHVPNPSFAPVNNNGGDIPEKHNQQPAALLQRTAQGGLQNSAQLTSEVAPHLPAILALAKAGRLDATQLAQLKTLVRVVTESKNRVAQQPGQQQTQGQRAGQGSPQVPTATPSFPSNPTTAGPPP